MPSHANSDAEPRALVTGGKRKATPNAQRYKKKRRKKSSTNDKPAASVDTEVNDRQNSQITQFSIETTSTKGSSQEPDMSSAFGRNRLATGFTKPSANGHEPADKVGSTSRSANRAHATSTAGESVDSPIQLSDDEEMGDSEGGIVLNVEDQKKRVPTIYLLDDDHSDDDGDNGVEDNDGDQKFVDVDSADQESGEISDDQTTFPPSRFDAPLRTELHAGTQQPSFTIDPTPMNIVKRLVDLVPAQREEQIKYAFYHLARDEIDLSRPVICLKCFSEGHLKEDCHQQSVFAALRPTLGRPIKLWISCCLCASKNHLIGDCPQADRTELKRWSLSELDPSQVINLSLDTGTRKLEKAADNRGMRPEGLSIKGRAGRHTAGFAHPMEIESSDDDLLHLDKRPRITGPQQTRYDRFEGPTQSPSRRRAGWYATDSFGRHRSQSPSQDRRPARDRRSPSPRHNSYRPDPVNRNGDTYRPQPNPSHSRQVHNSDRGFPRGKQPTLPGGADGKAPTSKRLPPPPIPKPNFQFDLPTRKGSKTWTSESSAQSGSSTPIRGEHGQGRRAKKKNKPRHQ